MLINSFNLMVLGRFYSFKWFDDSVFLRVMNIFILLAFGLMDEKVTAIFVCRFHSL